MKKEILFKGKNGVQIVKTDLNSFKYVLEIYDKEQKYNIGSLFLTKEQYEDLLEWKKEKVTE